jgi:isoleucyl-tRNA synthetase
MEMAQEISSMVLSIRKKMNIRVRQPLNRILIPVLNNHLRDQIDAVRNLILTEVNVKNLEYITDTSGVLIKKVKPDFKKLGPRVGKLMKLVAARLTALDNSEISTLEQQGELPVMVDGMELIISREEVDIISEDIPGWQVANAGNLTVALDITITPELWQEGIARELINRIQNLRKEKGFEVTDKIAVTLERQDEINLAVERNIPYICSETLAQDFVLTGLLEDEGKDLISLIDTASTYISIRKIE